jgi:hypothetical protein
MATRYRIDNNDNRANRRRRPRPWPTCATGTATLYCLMRLPSQVLSTLTPHTRSPFHPAAKRVADVILTWPKAALVPALPASSLHFLSTVDPAQIPLYLAAGPSLDVCTTTEVTQAWFESLLLSAPAGPAHTASADGALELELEWWARPRSQAPIGFLVQVQGIPAEVEKQRVAVTELLFYGSVAKPYRQGQNTSDQKMPAFSPSFC